MSARYSVSFGSTTCQWSTQKEVVPSNQLVGAGRRSGQAGGGGGRHMRVMMGVMRHMRAGDGSSSVERAQGAARRQQQSCVLLQMNSCTPHIAR